MQNKISYFFFILGWNVTRTCLTFSKKKKNCFPCRGKFKCYNNKKILILNTNMPFYCAAKDIFMTHFYDERVVSVCVVCTACICGVCGFAVCIFIWCACVCVWLSDLWIVSSCSLTMCASCWKMEPNSTMVLSMFCMVSARLWMYESFANTTRDI